MVSVVIPVYNHWDLSHSSLFGLYNNCRNSIQEVLLIDDCSTEPDGFDWWETSQLLPVKKIDLPENVGFLKASNYGLKKAKEDVKILLSNDVRITGNFVTPIVDILKQNPKSLVGGKLLDFNTGWNVFDGKQFNYLEGWMLAATSEGWEELGYFDEQFAPNDYEDVALSTTALKLGYDLKSLYPKFDLLHHMGGQSIGYNAERQALTEINREKFRQKWVK